MTTITGLKGSKGETGQADDTRAELNRLDAAVSQIQANISRELDDEINRVQRNGEHRIDEANQEIARLNSRWLDNWDFRDGLRRKALCFYPAYFTNWQTKQKKTL